VEAIAARAQPWRFVSSTLRDALLLALPLASANRVARVAEVRSCAIEVPQPTGEAIEEKRARVGAPFAVCAARLIPSKRVEVAIAWAHAQGIPLVVVGDGPEQASLERLARSHAAAGAPVHFIGRTSRTDALAWIAASAQLVQPSRDEGSSTVVREAEHLGIPVRAI
jgi:glycosyltransferase involved in cell wall biosynthesis